MAQFPVTQLDPVLVSQLESLARLHGRSLQEEIEFILQQAVQNQLRFRSTGGTMAEARAAVERSQSRFVGRSFGDSVELIREDRDR
jgi:antitoxin FitA